MPEQIVVVIVTPTAAQGATGQQGQSQGNQPASQSSEGQSSEGQAVAQAQPTAPPEGGQAGGEQAGGEQAGGEQVAAGQAQEEQAGDQELITMGEPIYTSNCAACHQPSGEGISNYPPLAGSAIVTAEDPAAAIETVVNGRGQMPAFGSSLSADEIAAVLSYVRNSWGNSASVVTADQVSQIQGGGAQAAGETQATPAVGTQVTPTVEARSAPAGEAQATPAAGAQVTPTIEAQASPTPQAGSAEQAAGTVQVQVAPVGTGSQMTVTQGQAGNVITIRIEIVIVTPEAAAAPAGQGSQPAPAQPTVPAPSQAQPTEAAQPTPASQGESSGGAAPGSATATPSPQAQGAQSGTTGEIPAQPTPVSQGESSGGAAIGSPAAQGEQGSATGEAQSADQELLAMGEYLYGTTCANCHQLSGEGNTAYPSLVNNEFIITEDPTAAILTILNGRGHMPAFAGMLSDQEIAAILSHERNSWGNSASIVTAEQVAQLRGDGSAQPAAITAPQGAVAPALASRASGAPSYARQEAVTVSAISGEQAALYMEQFLERPEVAAIISYVRTLWNKNAPLVTNVQVQ